jgi:hypothetical protein
VSFLDRYQPVYKRQRAAYAAVSLPSRRSLPTEPGAPRAGPPWRPVTAALRSWPPRRSRRVPQPGQRAKVPRRATDAVSTGGRARRAAESPQRRDRATATPRPSLSAVSKQPRSAARATRRTGLGYDVFRTGARSLPRAAAAVPPRQRERQLCRPRGQRCRRRRSRRAPLRATRRVAAPDRGLGSRPYRWPHVLGFRRRASVSGSSFSQPRSRFLLRRALSGGSLRVGDYVDPLPVRRGLGFVVVVPVPPLVWRRLGVALG